MKVRLGYACISETTNVTTSTPYTYTSFKKENNYDKLDKIIKSNFLALYQLLKYNQKNNIHFFRMTSALIPLATKKEVNFNYLEKYKNYYNLLANLIEQSKIRVDFHPSQFCVLNSTKEGVLDDAKEILTYHYNILDALKIKDKVLVLHIGSNTFGKTNSIKRFINNFKKLDSNIQNSIAIENDDKVFSIEDCLYISNIIKTPVILDYHHYLCNHENDNIDELIPLILKTWKNKTPKIHFSSPKNKTKKEFRSHNDYIDSSAFINFIEKIKKYDIDIDIMIEAKKKDEALFRLVRELKYKTNYNFIDDTTFST